MNPLVNDWNESAFQEEILPSQALGIQLGYYPYPAVVSEIGNQFLHCPLCGDNFVHFRPDLARYDSGKDDYATGTGVRGGVYRIPCYCEACRGGWDFALMFHKGTTKIGVLNHHADSDYATDDTCR